MSIKVGACHTAEVILMRELALATFAALPKKKRRGVLRAVTEAVAQPVIPMGPVEKVRLRKEVRETWEQLLPELLVIAPPREHRG